MEKSTKKLLSILEKLNSKLGLESPKKPLVSLGVEIKDISFNCLLGYLQSSRHDFFYWNINEINFTSLGSKKLMNFYADGKLRTTLTDESVSKLKENFISNWDEIGLKNVPLIMGGMKFAPGSYNGIWKQFHDSDWVLYQYLYLRFEEKFFFIYNYHYNPNKLDDIKKNLLKGIELIEKNNTKTQIESLNSDKTFAKIIDIPDEKKIWNNKVNYALKFIRIKVIQKIVLSRKKILEFNTKPKLNFLLTRLSKVYPRCYVFAFRKCDSIFFGASPEKLAKIKDGWIEADALAGSFPRGKSELEDKILENELLTSTKNLNEQKAVVNFLIDSFNKFSGNIIFDEKPIIRKLPNIQHLWTLIKAKLEKDYKLFSILKEIHPTPAICGTPWDKALIKIKEIENFERGFFAGIIGWFNFDNEGEFAVAIRSALLKEKTLHAFAGCGIVDGSNPEAEYNETELKLRPIISLFNYGKSE
ncbi:MAG: isochorismate synthase [Ignavibacteria bacterium]